MEVARRMTLMCDDVMMAALGEFALAELDGFEERD